MARIRNNIEGRFEDLGRVVTTYPKIILLGIFILLGVIISNLSNIKIDTSSEGFLHPSDPTLVEYNKFRDEFGRDDKVVIAIKGKDIFDPVFLSKLRDLHKEIENTAPFVKEVDSLVNARNTRGEADKLIVEDLLENFPTNKQEIEEIRKRAMDSVFYKNLFLSEDGTFTTIVIETVAYSQIGVKQSDDLDGFEDDSEDNSPKEFLTDQENNEFVEKVKEITEKYKSEDFKIELAGSPIVTSSLKISMSNDMGKFMKLGILTIIIFLFIMFRRVTGVIYPVLVIILTLLSTIGMMAYSGVAFKIPTQILPSLLLAVSIGATVHILAIFYREFNKTGNKRESIIYSLGHSGLAIFMTSLTTAVGVGSFAGAEVAPIADMGIFAAFGVMISFILTILMLPALLQITPLKVKESFTEKEGGLMDILLLKVANFPINNPKTVIAISMLLVLASLLVSNKVRLSHNPLEWFPNGDSTKYATRLIDKELKGSVTIEAVIDTKETNGWYDPKRLQKLEDLTKEIESYKDDKYFVGKVIAIPTILKEINRALNENQESEYKIPTDKDLIAQEFLLFENSGSDDLEKIIDSQFSKTRVTIKMPWLDAIESRPLLLRVENRIRETFQNAEVTITGLSSMFNRTLNAALYSAAQSYIIAFVFITVLMIFMMGSIRIGLISMIPNLSPIIIGISLMYFYDIPLDMFTMLIGSIAIGMAVDDTIHFFHNYQRYYRASGDIREAVEQTFLTTGRAMIITTVVLVSGFLIYLFATMTAVQNFGLLTGFVIFMALIADLMLAPALMVIISKRGWIK